MTWQRVCSTRDVVPGRLASFVVDGVTVIVAGLDDGGFSIFPPACPHMEEPLEKSGMCAGSVLTCSKHLYQWDMRTGKAAGPEENDLTLLRYDVKIENGDVYARIEDELVYEHEDGGDDDFEW